MLPKFSDGDAQSQWTYFSAGFLLKENKNEIKAERDEEKGGKRKETRVGLTQRKKKQRKGKLSKKHKRKEKGIKEQQLKRKQKRETRKTKTRGNLNIKKY